MCKQWQVAAHWITVRQCGAAIWCLLMRRFWLRLSVFSSHFLSPQEDPYPPLPRILLYTPLAPSLHTSLLATNLINSSSTSSTFQLIRNSRHIVGPLCKRKSPWITGAASFCSSQSSVHCGKLINQAQALQKDLKRREVIVQKPSSWFLFFYLLKSDRCTLK